MINKYSKIIFISLSLLLVGCATNQFQKRKYTKGFFREQSMKVNDHFDNEQVKPDQFAGSDRTEELDEGPTSETYPTTKHEEAANISKPASITTNESIDETAEEPVELEDSKSTDYGKEKKILAEGNEIYRPNANRFKRADSADKWTNEETKTAFENSRHSEFGFLGILLLLILAFILPPLAVVIYDGFSGLFWIDLILWLIGLGVGFAFFVGSGLIWLSGSVATILAILVVLGLFD